MNFSAVAASLQVAGPSLVAAMTADVTIMALYLGLISSIPVNVESLDKGKKLQEPMAPGDVPMTAHKSLQWYPCWKGAV